MYGLWHVILKSLLLYCQKCFKWINQNPRIFSFSLSFSPFQRFQQGHSAAFYRDHPQDIRHRTIQSRKPPPLSTHLMKGDPDSATSPSKYKQRSTPVLPPPDVTLNTPVTEVQRIRAIESLKDENFKGLLLDLDTETDKGNNDKKMNKVPPSREAAMRLALNRRGIRVDRTMSVRDDEDDEEDSKIPSKAGSKSKPVKMLPSRDNEDDGEDRKKPKKTASNSKAMKMPPSRDGNKASNHKINRMKTPMAANTMTTSDSDDEVVRPRRKPRKKKRDKIEPEPERSLARSPTRKSKISVTTKNDDDDAFETDKKERSKVDGYVLTQWKQQQERDMKKVRTKSTSQAPIGETGSAEHKNMVEVEMQRLLHRSNTGFCMDDVKNALENAKVMGKSDQDLDQISGSDDAFQKLTKDQMIERKKHLASKWQKLATKIMTQETLVGDEDVDKALLSIKFTKLGKAIPEVDETSIAERTKHVTGSVDKTDYPRNKILSRSSKVPETPAKKDENENFRERYLSKNLKDSKSRGGNVLQDKKPDNNQNSLQSKIPKPNSPTRRMPVPAKPESDKREKLPPLESRSRLSSPTKKDGPKAGQRPRQLSPLKREPGTQIDNSDSVFPEAKDKRTKTPHKNKLEPIESKGSKARQPSPSKKDKRDKNYYASANGDVFTFKDAVMAMEGVEDIQLPPVRESLGEAMSFPKNEDTEAESSKRLELIKAARKAIKDTPDDPKTAKNTKQKAGKTGGRVHLPLTTKKPKKKMPGEEDADMEFYKAFKLLYVDLPVPEDELPCE